MTEPNESDPGFPWLAMMALCTGMLAHSIVFTAPLPFVAFMVVDFKMSDSVDTAGYYAGWITGAFMLGRTFASIGWGLASDRFGRRSCLLVTMFNVAILGLLLGFSTSFMMAVTLRLAIGLGNGFMAIAKTCVSEICTKDQEMRGFGLLNGVWGLGLIVGPSIGGLLSRPAVQYPRVFSRSGLWGRYPYLLPCIMSASVAVLAFMFIYFFLPETVGGNGQARAAGVHTDSDAPADTRTVTKGGSVDAECSKDIEANATTNGEKCSTRLPFGSGPTERARSESLGKRQIDAAAASSASSHPSTSPVVKALEMVRLQPTSPSSSSAVGHHCENGADIEQAPEERGVTMSPMNAFRRKIVDSINNGIKSIQSRSPDGDYSKIRFHRVSGSDCDVDSDEREISAAESRHDSRTSVGAVDPEIHRQGKVDSLAMDHNVSRQPDESQQAKAQWPAWWPFRNQPNSIEGTSHPTQTSSTSPCENSSTATGVREDRTTHSSIPSTGTGNVGDDEDSDSSKTETGTGTAASGHGLSQMRRYFSIRNMTLYSGSGININSLNWSNFKGAQRGNTSDKHAYALVSNANHHTDCDDGIEDACDKHNENSGTNCSASASANRISEDKVSVSELSSTAADGVQHDKKPTTLLEMIKDPHILFVSTIYMSFSFSVMFVDEVFPLWCVSSTRRGGMSWSSAQVGSTLACCGLALVIYQFFFYEPCVKRCCPAKQAETFFRLASISSISIATLPFAAYAALQVAHTSPASEQKHFVWLPFAIIVVILTVYRGAANAAFSTLAMVVNASVDRELRGTLNGFMMTCGSIGNALGPILGASLYAAAVALPKKSGIDGRIAFLIASVLILLLATAAKCFLKARN